MIMTVIAQTREALDAILFHDPATNIQRRIHSALLLLLFLTGIAHWVGFFNGGELALTAYDWIKEDAYLDTLRAAQVNAEIPWRWNTAFYHDTRDFLANPETILTPDILLLRWLPNGLFILLHVLLFYSIGFLACMLIANRLNISLAPFSAFWLLFNFNGHLTAHLGVGHLQWAGYFLLPVFFLVLSGLIQAQRGPRSKAGIYPLTMGLLLGLLFLNGSFHFAIFCTMFMLIALCWRMTMAPGVAIAILIGGLLGFGRLLPALLWIPSRDLLYAGYPSFGTLIDAMTMLRGHELMVPDELYTPSTWWELDLYLGFTGTTISIIALIAVSRRKAPSDLLPIFAAAGVLLLFSLGHVYTLIQQLPVPFADVERVPTRFIVMPLVLALILVMKGLDELLCAWPKITKPGLLIALPFIGYELYLHSSYWRVGRIESTHAQVTKPILSIASDPDTAYALSIGLGWLVSVVVLVGVVAYLVHMRRHRDERNAPAR